MIKQLVVRRRAIRTGRKALLLAPGPYNPHFEAAKGFLSPKTAIFGIVRPDPEERRNLIMVQRRKLRIC